MPIILDVPQDPTDLVLQGESLRDGSVQSRAESWWPIITDDETDGTLPLSPNIVVAGDQGYAPMTVLIQGSILLLPVVRVNAVLCTPCGASVPVETSRFARFVQQTSLWALTGVTKDSAGAPLSNCRVLAIDAGQLAHQGMAGILEVMSDGSGNYTLPVPTNTGYQVMAYKAGAPDVAGATKNNVVPTAIG